MIADGCEEVIVINGLRFQCRFTKGGHDSHNFEGIVDKKQVISLDWKSVTTGASGEMADTQVLGTCEETREGSSPS